MSSVKTREKLLRSELVGKTLRPERTESQSTGNQSDLFLLNFLL